jgi:hypothetical protein
MFIRIPITGVLRTIILMAGSKKAFCGTSDGAICAKWAGTHGERVRPTVSRDLPILSHSPVFDFDDLFKFFLPPDRSSHDRSLPPPHRSVED